VNDLSGIFRKKLNQLGIKKQVDAAMICEAFNKSVSKVFGEEGEKNVRAISFRNGALKIGVTSSIWANEVNARSQELNREYRLRYEVVDNLD